MARSVGVRRVERQDARADLHSLRHCGQEPHGGDGVGAVGLARPDVLDPHVLQPSRVGREPRRGRRASPPWRPASLSAPLEGLGRHFDGLAPSDNRGYCLAMSIAITEDHRALGQTASDFLAKHDSRGAARALLEAEVEALPPFWVDLAELGWLGLHLPEDKGGSGFGLPELVVVTEELGRAVTPGPFVSTVVVSAVINESAPEELASRLLPGLADGSTFGGFALTSHLSVSGGKASGTAPAVLGGGLAHVLLLPAGDDVIVVEAGEGEVTISVPANLDPTRRTARVTLKGAPAEVIPGGRQALVDLARIVIAAEATGIATECTEQAAAYAKVRVQFGRPIATFEAVKHHCANMLVASELATATVWDAARGRTRGATRGR